MKDKTERERGRERERQSERERGASVCIIENSQTPLLATKLAPCVYPCACVRLFRWRNYDFFLQMRPDIKFRRPITEWGINLRMINVPHW